MFDHERVGLLPQGNLYSSFLAIVTFVVTHRRASHPHLRQGAIGGVVVNNWGTQPRVTRDVAFVVASDAIERAVTFLDVPPSIRRLDTRPWVSANGGSC